MASVARSARVLVTRASGHVWVVASAAGGLTVTRTRLCGLTLSRFGDRGFSAPASPSRPTEARPPPPPPAHDDPASGEEAGEAPPPPPPRWEDQDVDFYAVLGVKRDAPADEIKTAFRAAAKKYHPDVAKDDASVDAFQLVNEAYSVLSDPELRKAYDAHGSRHTRAMGNSTLTLRQRNEGVWSTSWNKDGLSADEAFRRGMARANERAKDAARVRATLARMNRQKLEMPTKSESLTSLVWPITVLTLSAATWVHFMAA